MKKAKLLALLLALAMVISMFAACKKEDPKPADGEGEGEGDTPKESVRLTWWHWGEQPKDSDAVIAALNEMSKKDLGVEVDFIWATGDPTKMKTALSTGATDDIFHTSGIDFTTMARSGMFYDITDLLDKVGGDIKAHVPAAIWQGATIDGRIYAVPVRKDNAAVNYWYCNKDYVFDLAGAEAEFMAAKGPDLSLATPLMKKVYDYNKNGGEPYPHDLTAPLTINFQGLRGLNVSQDVAVLSTANLTLPEDSEELTLGYTTTSYLKNLKTANEWFKAGYINQDCDTLQKEPDFNIIQSAAGWEGAEITAWGAGKDYTVTIVQRTMNPILSASSIQAAMLGVFANSKHPEEAVKFIQYLNLNADYRNTLGYGVKDRNWKENDDGSITQLNTDWYPGNWIQGSFFAGLKVISPAPADMYEKMAKVQATAVAARTMGFVPDITPIETEVAACAAIVEKWKTQLVCGSMSDVDATIAGYTADMKAAGFDVVRDEIQKQFDEFRGK